MKWNPADVTNETLLAEAYRSLGAKTALPAEKESTPGGQAAMRKQMLKMTAEEEQTKLLKDPSGASTLEANRAKAESLYREAISRDPALAEPHRGLGMLYQDEGKSVDAVTEYQAYLDLAAAKALDRLRIQRRIESLKSAAEDGRK